MGDLIALGVIILALAGVYALLMLNERRHLKLAQRLNARRTALSEKHLNSGDPK